MNKYTIFLVFSIIPFLLSCGEEKITPESPHEEPVKISSISVSPDDISMSVGMSRQLEATVSPSSYKDYTFSWSSSQPSVASVNEGLVTAHAVGTAVITVSTMGKEAQCRVTVKESSIKVSFKSSDAPGLKSTGGIVNISINTKADWKITSDESWISASPTTGNNGNNDVVLTTKENTSGKDRVAQMTISSGDEYYTFSVKQRANVFSRTKVASGKVTNGVKLTYSGTRFTRIYVVLPRPVTNNYQDISNFKATGSTLADCPDMINHYIWKDAKTTSIPESGNLIIEEFFDANVYNVTVDFSKITDIPEYDPQSEECKNYLKKEKNGLIDPTNSKIASTAESLWKQSNNDIIEYARKCHEWTNTNIKYGNLNTGLHTIAELMSTMTGDCGNYSSVFISLLRAKGIPARHVVMVHGKEDEFHVRAEFYVPTYGWIPADPTWGSQYFGVFTGDYIVTAQGINNVVRGPDGKDYNADLLQTCYFWCWYQTEGTYSFTHTCTGLK